MCQGRFQNSSAFPTLHNAFHNKPSRLCMCLVALGLSGYHRPIRAFVFEEPRIALTNAQDEGGHPRGRHRRLDLESQATEFSPLTLRELRDMLARHADNAPIKMVLEDALKRRLTDLPKGLM